MKLEKYLSIESSAKNITKKDAEDLINKHCKKSLNSTPIYRGIKNNSEALLVKPQKTLRVSAYADTNIQTLLIDNLPSWKEYPKRSKSVICTTDKENAKGYGNSSYFRVYPFDNSKIGVCPSNDIWFSFYKSFGGEVNLNDFVVDFARLVSYLILDNHTADFEGDLSVEFYDRNMSMNTLLKLIKKAEKNLIDIISFKTKKEKRQLQDIIEEIVERVQMEDELIPFLRPTPDFLGDFDNLLDPSKNGFALKKAGDTLPLNKEVWTDGNSIMIRDK